MFIKIPREQIYKANHDWLTSYHHFSFAEYYDPANLGYGDLRVLNDDIIKPHTGFDTHPHKNMEIITYIINGELTHGDSMNNEKTINPGYIQYISAGTGITHSEFNNSNQDVRLLQIWITPDKTGYEPNYGDYNFSLSSIYNNLLKIISSKDGDAPVKINNNVNFYAFSGNEEITFDTAEDKMLYLVLISGIAEINQIVFHKRDALKTDDPITIKPLNDAHYLLIELDKK